MTRIHPENEAIPSIPEVPRVVRLEGEFTATKGSYHKF